MRGGSNTNDFGNSSQYPRSPFWNRHYYGVNQERERRQLSEERGESGTYKTGASRLAVATGAYIVPIAVTSARCWPRRSFSFIPGVVDVSIGPPLSAKGREQTELMAEVELWIESEMHRLDPDAYENHEQE